MKQGKSYFTVILWILLAAIAAYFGYHVISSLYAPLMTATVTPYEAGAGYYASGFVVREEELLYSQYGTTVLSCAEGAHVAANDTVATGYRSEDARLRQTRMDELSGQIEQLQYAWSAVSSVYDQAALDADIADALAQLSRYLALRDMNSVSDLSPELKGLILRRTGSGADSGALQSRISALQAELDTLEAQSAGDTSAISAGMAGTFSAAVDGYEAVLTPERLMDMTVVEFEAVQPDEADAHAIGRLITSTTWYYACVVPASELSDVEEGDRATLTFARDYYQPVTMRVERLGENEAGSRLLVLSSDRALQNVTAPAAAVGGDRLHVLRRAARPEVRRPCRKRSDGRVYPRRDARQVEAHHHSPRYRRKLCRHARHQLDQQPLAGRRADYQREKSIRWKGRQLICLQLLKISRISAPRWLRPQKKPDATRPKFCCAPRRR